MGTSVAVVVVFGSASFVPLPVLIPLLLLPVLLVELLLELELLLLELLLLLSLSFRLVEGAAVAVGRAVVCTGGTAAAALVFSMFTDAFLAASRCGTTRKSAMNSLLLALCLSCFFRPEVVVEVAGVSLLVLLDEAYPLLLLLLAAVVVAGSGGVGTPFLASCLGAGVGSVTFVDVDFAGDTDFCLSRFASARLNSFMAALVRNDGCCCESLCVLSVLSLSVLSESE